MTHDSITDEVKAGVTGYVFSFMIAVFNHPATHAFLYGFLGALGGLCCKLIYSKIKTWTKEK